MNTIDYGIIPIPELLNKPDSTSLTELEELVVSKFGFPVEEFRELLYPHIEVLRDDLFVVVEYPYVDKVYRNSYYSYYSTKHLPYQRDCIRLSFFKPIPGQEFTVDLFRGGNQFEPSNLGFYIIRPIVTAPLGRSMISPYALKKCGFYCRVTKETTLVIGRKFVVEGFPYSSQDGETITCAETTLWSIMEYFGSEYKEYKSIQPSTIIKVLEDLAWERQLPSNGLTEEEISYTLKKFGFGVKTYGGQALATEEDGLTLRDIISYYIESGIPLIGIIQDQKKEKIAHAVVVIGHGSIEQDAVKTTAITEVISLSNKERDPYLELQDNEIVETLTEAREISLIDTARIKKDLVIIDDRQYVYKTVDFDNPAMYFAKDYPNIDKCIFTGIAVPLYPKIYLDALGARKLFKIMLEELYPKETLHDELYLRMFLTSSRSFKSKVNENFGDNCELRDVILDAKMPRFIWVCEISNHELYLSNNFSANGLIIIDATEASEDSLKTLILATLEGNLFYFDNDDKLDIEIMEINTNPFPMYKNNLKHFI